MQKQTTTSKKHGLGRGMDALTAPAVIPTETIRNESPAPRTQWQQASDTVAKVGLVLTDALPGMDGGTRDIVLQMIISLCQSELRGGGR